MIYTRYNSSTRYIISTRNKTWLVVQSSKYWYTARRILVPLEHIFNAQLGMGEDVLVRIIIRSVSIGEVLCPRLQWFYYFQHKLASWQRACKKTTLRVSAKYQVHFFSNSLQGVSTTHLYFLQYHDTPILLVPSSLKSFIWIVTRSNSRIIWMAFFAQLCIILFNM